MKTLYKILYLEDLEADVERVTDLLQREYVPCEISWVKGCEALATALQGAGWAYDLVFLGSLPAGQVTQALASAQEHGPQVPVIVLLEDLDEARAVDCLRNGATDFVLRTHLARLGPVVRRALEAAREAAGRRAAEAANTRLAALLRATLDASTEGLLVVDLAGKIATYNRKFMTLCGIPEYVMAPMEMESVLKFLLDQFQDPEAFLNEARLLGNHAERETAGLLTTKGDRIVEEVGRPHRIGNQTVGRIYSFRDVTEQARAGDSSRHLATTHLALLECARAGRIGLWYASQDRLVCSEALMPMLGLPAGDLPKDLKALEALIHPEDRDAFLEALERPRNATVHLRLRKVSGEWIHTQWNLDRDAAGSYQGAILDITDQWRLQQDSGVRQRTEWMSILTANLTRAFRAPLQALQGHLAALEAGPLTVHNRRELEAAASATRTLNALVEQMTQAASQDPGPRVLMDLNDLVEKVQPWARTTLGDGIDLKLELAGQLPTLPLNLARMEPVLMNLLLNAKEALQGRGEIWIRTGRALGEKLNGFDAAPLFVEVQDNGPGIPPRVKEQMFDPFFTTRTGSDGLGLSVVRCIVESYGGRIQVDTEPRRGTAIRVVLPVP